MTDSEEGWLWYAGEGETSEIYPIALQSREEAISSARSHYGPDVFNILCGRQDREAYLPTASSIIESILENANNQVMFGEDGDGEIMGTETQIADAENELSQFLVDWMGRHREIFPKPVAITTQYGEEVFNKPEAEK